MMLHTDLAVAPRPPRDRRCSHQRAGILCRRVPNQGVPNQVSGLIPLEFDYQAEGGPR